MKILTLILFLTVSSSFAQQPETVNYLFNVKKPVVKNQVIDTVYSKATDPEKKAVLHKIVSGTGRKYFYTTDNGGIFVKDAKTINRSRETKYTLTLSAADNLNLTSFARITINVK